MATLESVIQKINLLIEDANDTTGSLHSNLRDAVDALILGYGGYGNIEVDSISEIHLWSKYTIGGSIIEEQVTNIQLFWKLASSSDIFEIDYADSYEIVDNAISLVNPTTITLGRDSESRNTIKGKYVKRGNVYYIPTDAKVSYGNYTNHKTIEVDKAAKITYTASDSEFVCIVVSDDINAYPQNGEQDGYKYVYNGTLDDTTSVPVLQSKTVTPSETAQTVTPDSGYDGLSSVSVAGDADLVAGNIKKGVNIFGVTGSYEATGGTTLPALTVPGTADDLAKGKQLIDADGNVVTGTIPVKDIAAQSQFNSAFFDSQNGKISVVAKLGEKAIVSETASIFANVPASEFGDAKPEEVLAGKTFTSAAGVKVTGTHKCTGGGDGYEVDSLSELHAWSKYTIVSGSVVETPLTNHVIAGDYSNDNAYVDYADTYSIVDGEISLDNPSSAYMYGITTELPVYGKYIYSRYQNAYYYVPDDAIITLGSDANGRTMKASKVTLLTYQEATGTTEEFVSIVVSDDITAYPQNGEQDGYKYVYNGTLGSGGDFIVTDDGAGNVTITSSAITDNNGNVVIA